ncbi:MAG: hypothetical protein VB021_09795 [Oscillospiraceae bacterium]|nr:hypothetical protein [Oscillospiraceae bacterium]
MKQITVSDFSQKILEQKSEIPIILCSITPRIKRKLEEAGYVDLSLNEKLASALIQYPTATRGEHVLSALQQIFL